MQTARELLGKKVKEWREHTDLSISQLAVKMGTKRTFIYDIEAGRKNFTIDYWEKLLRACGIPPSTALAGFTSADIPQDLYRLLKIIVDKGNDDLIHGIRINLDAIADKALRLHNRARSPTPSQREGQDGDGGHVAGRHKRRPS